MTRTKWRTVIFALIALLALLVSACSSSEDPDEPQAVEPAPTSAPEPADEPDPEPEPADEPADEPVDEPEPADEPADESADEPADEPEPEPEPTEAPTPIPVPEGSTVGITDDTIKVGILRSDSKSLEDAGILPDTGDIPRNYEVFAKQVNARGGAGGRNIEIVFHQYPPGASATDQQAACIGATEDDEVAIVHFVGGVTAETVLCATEDHERIAYMLSGILPQEIYDRSNGRLFSQAMTTERLMGAWPAMVEAQGLLEGHTLGLMRGDIGEHEVAAGVLEAALADAGYELADQVALPCQGTSCSQVDIGLERMQAAGVDTIFSLVPPSPFGIAVYLAGQSGLDPQWLVSDIENLVFDSVAQAVYGRSADPTLFYGLYGVSYGLDRLSPDEPTTECNAVFTEVTGISYDIVENKDAWSAVGSTCLFIKNLEAAANWSQDTYGTVNQTTLIQGFESLTDYRLGDVTGSWTPTKHDAPDWVTLKEYRGDCACWVEIDGARMMLDQ